MELDVLIVVVLVMPLYFIINKNLFSDKRDLECFLKTFWDILQQYLSVTPVLLPKYSLKS